VPTKAPTKAPTKPNLNATTKPATNFSVNKTNASIRLTELGDHYPRDCSHLHQEKKLPATIQEKKSTPKKKINLAEAALAASEAVDQEKGGAESENEPGPCGECWLMIVETSSKWTITIIFFSILLAIKGGEAFASSAGRLSDVAPVEDCAVPSDM
jgi:hypothetical protein